MDTFGFVIDAEGDTNNVPSVGNTNNVPSVGNTNNISAKCQKSKSKVEQIFAQFEGKMTQNVKKKEPKTIFKKFYRNMKQLPDNTEDIEITRPKNKEVEEVMKKSVLTKDFENLPAVPSITEKKEKEIRKRQREMSKEKWFGMPAAEVTDEIKRDLEVLQMRSVLDPKHFYKKNDLKVLPKYFQIGTVMDSPLDFYNNRLTKKERKKTLVDELLADAEFHKYNKKRYAEIVTEQKRHRRKSKKKP